MDYSTIINQSGVVTTITTSDYSLEIAIFILAYALVYVLIMNMGKNITPYRRFMGAVLNLALGIICMLFLKETELGIIGFTVFGISIIYFIFQVGIAIGDINKMAADKDKE